MTEKPAEMCSICTTHWAPAVIMCTRAKEEKPFLEVTLDNVSSGQCQPLCMSVLIRQVCVCVCACVQRQFVWWTKSKQHISTLRGISGRSPERAACGCLDRGFNSKLSSFLSAL